MKQVYIGLFLIFSISCVYAQNSTGINTSTPVAKAALDIRNSSGFPQGVLFPRLPGSDTTALKTGVTAREKGLIFFDTTNNVYRSWNGTKWVTFASSAASGEAWDVYGNTLLAADTGYVSGFKYIGTNNAFPFIIATDGIERMRVSRTGNVAIGMKPSGGIPLQLKSNGIGLVFRIEKSASTDPLFEFRQNTGNHARMYMYDGSGSATPTIEIHADPTASSYFNVAKFGIGNNSPAERLHITNGPILLEGQVNSPTATPTSGAIKFQGSTGLNHAILNESVSNDLVFWHRNGGPWTDNTRFTVDEFKTGKVGTNIYGFMIDATGNAVKINNVTYSWPVTQGTGVLTNDGTGGLTWATSAGGITGTGSTNTIPYWMSTNALGFSTMIYNGTSYAIGAAVSNALTFQVQSATTVSLYAQNTAGGGTGVWGYSSNTGGVAGVRGVAVGTGKGIYGSTSSATGFGGHFENTGGGAALTTGLGNVGIGVSIPVNKLDIEGGAVIGTTYSGTQTAPANGLLVEGNVGIGTNNPVAPLQVNGNVALGNGAAANGANKAVTVFLTNRSGAARVTGDIVIAGGGGANSFTITTTASATSAIGVLAEDCASLSVCQVAVSGVITVRSTAGTIGQHCITSAVQGVAGTDPTPTAGASIGVYLSNSTGTTCQVLLR